MNASSTRFEYFNIESRVDSFMKIQQGQGEARSFRISDGLGRVVASATVLPDSLDGGYAGQKIIYDIMGRVSQTSKPTETNASGTPSQWNATGDDTQAGWIYTTQTYDWKGRPLVTTNPSTTGNPAQTTTKTASYTGCGCAGGEIITLTDEVGRRQKIYGDVLGRTRKTEILNWDGTVYSTTVNAYNARDQITDITEYAGVEGSPTSQVTTMVYDGFGRLESQHMPEQATGTATVWTYNADDTIHSVTDARGCSQTFDYNSRHLMTSIIYDAGSSGASTPAPVTFEYDAAGNRTSMTDGFGDRDYEYNSLSQLTHETRAFGIGTFGITYDYNLAGQLNSVTDPFGASFTYTRNVQGQLKALTGSPYAGTTDYITDVTYRAWGAPKSVNYPGSSSTIAYNARMQPKEFRLTANGSGASIIRENYGYLADGKVATLTDLDDTAGNNPPQTLRFLSRAYEFDHAGRVIHGFGNGGGGQGVPYNQSYSYDEFGNMTGRSGVYYSYNSGGFSSDTATYVKNRRTTWSYNLDGQVTNTPLTSTDRPRGMTYDAAGRLITSVESGEFNTVTYNAA